MNEHTISDTSELALLRKRIAELETRGTDFCQESERKLLKICHMARNKSDLMRSLVLFFQGMTGCEAVGVRLRQGEDFPYFETRGFPGSFTKAENFLCARDVHGNLQRDSSGSPVLDCMCGNILCARFDFALPFFTVAGSFWTNSTSNLLASTSEADRQSRTRNRCNGEGYESVALIPLRILDKTFGLFQFNDPKKDRFSPEIINQLEGLVSYVALTLDKHLTDEELHESEHLLKFSQRLTKSGGWQWDVVYETMTWTEETYRIHDIDPRDLVHGCPELIALSKACYAAEDQTIIMTAFKRCVELGEPYDLEFSFTTHKGRQLWIRTTAGAIWSEGRIGKVIGNIIDITEHKLVEMELQESEKTLKAILNTSPEAIFLMATDGTVLAANEALGRRLKIPAESLLGSNLYNYISPELATARRIHVQRAVDTGKSYCFEDQRESSIIEHNIIPIFNETGSVSQLAIFSQDITERKRMDEHLKIYQNIVSSTPDGIAFFDAQYRYVIVNDAYERFSGVSREKFIGQTVAEYLGEEVFEKSIKLRFDKCLQGEIISFQQWFDYPSLGRRFVEVTYCPYRNIRNQIVGVVTNTRDLTNRKKNADLLAARLRLSEASVTLGLNDLLTLALDEAEAVTDSRIGFFHLFDDDQKTIILQAWSTATSNTFCKAQGTGMHYNLEDAGIWADCIRQSRVIAHNDYAGLSHRRGMPDGHAPVVRELVVPVFRNERIVAIFAVGNKALEYNDKDIELVSNLGDLVWDIVLRKRAEESLKESEEQFRTLASLAPVGIYITSPEGKCRYANPRWCEMAGLTQAGALGEGWIAGLHPDDRAMVYGNWQQMVESEGHWGFEYRFQTPGGKTTWVYGLAAPQRDGTGKIVRYIGVNTDITEKRQSEEALKNSLAEKEVLLREVHHRVKNNMAAIIGLFNLQRQAMNNPQAQTIMNDLSSRVKAMSLVHEKLYRSESLAKIDFQDYLQSLISHLRSSFGSPTIRCEIKAFGVEMPLDLAVPCGMIINELIINALKYAFPNERPETVKKDDWILVTAHRDNDIFHLSVADNGVGLPQGFDLKTVKSLGLVLVRMLGQHQLGGRYEVDQTGGTRFNLIFSMRNGRKGHE